MYETMAEIESEMHRWRIVPTIDRNIWMMVTTNVCRDEALKAGRNVQG
jgi:hypothetical protein